MRWLRISRLLLVVVVMAAAGCLYAPARAEDAGEEPVLPPVEKRWGKELKLAEGAYPAVEGYTAYAVVSGERSAVAAFELANGRSRWQYPLNERSGTAGTSFRLTVKQGVAYVSGGERVYAIRDKETKGELLWSASVKQVEGPPVVTNRAVYVTEKGERLTALNPSTGSRMWPDVEVPASRTAAAADGKLFVPFKNKLSAYEEQSYTLSLLWSVTFNDEKAAQGTAMTRPAYHRETLFVGLGPMVYGVNANNGDVLWKVKLSAAVVSDPVAGKGLVFVQTADGATLALNAETGELVWRLPGRADGAPLVSGNVLFIPSVSSIQAVDVRTGQVLDDVQVGNPESKKGIWLTAGNRFLVANVGGTELAALLAKDRNIKIYIDGELLGEKSASYDRVPVIVNGRVLVPIRALLESFGAKVTWNSSSQTVAVDKDGRQLVIAVGKKEARINGKPVLLDVPPQVIDGRTMVPIRFICEYLDTSVHWDGETRSVFIYRTKVFPGQQLFIDGQAIPGGITLYYHGYHRVLLGDAKPLFDHMGGTIRVDRPFAQVTVTVGQDSLVFGPQKYVTVDGRKISVYGPYFMPEEQSREGRFYLDLDFFYKAYGWTYRWNRDEKALYIWTKPEA